MNFIEQAADPIRTYIAMIPGPPWLRDLIACGFIVMLALALTSWLWRPVARKLVALIRLEGRRARADMRHRARLAEGIEDVG
jgi:hypothetical protein